MQEVDVETGNYLAGFTDGEGCFYVGVHPNTNVTLGLQVIPEFHVSQNGEEFPRCSCLLMCLVAVQSRRTRRQARATRHTFLS
jgi:hypothetical protein